VIVSQGSVAIYARCGGIFDICLTANLPRNLAVKKILNRLRIDRIMVMSLWPRFLAYPVGCANTAALQQHADRIGVVVFGSYQVF